MSDITHGIMVSTAPGNEAQLDVVTQSIRDQGLVEGTDYTLEALEGHASYKFTNVEHQKEVRQALKAENPVHIPADMIYQLELN